MQKFLLALIFTIAGTTMFAQKIDDVTDLMGKEQWEKAKDAVDKFLANEKNAKNADGWYYKANIYNSLSKDDKFKSLSQDLKMESFNAYKKYLEIDPKAIRGTLLQHVLLFDIYNGYFDEGAKSFNDKNYEKAGTSFKNALTIEEYIAGKGYSYNGFSFPSFDTALVQNIALSYYQAKNEDDAAIWYQKMADRKIAGKDYLDVYQFLVDYYNKKKDMANREKYMKTGRELYPDNDYWLDVELADVDSKDKKKLFAKYEELIAKYPGKYLMNYNYSVELFNYNYTGDSKPADYAETQAKIESALKRTIEINSTADANMLMARHIYNMVYDIQDAQKLIKGTTPADQKKKADLKTQMIAKVDMMLPYAQKAFDIYDAKANMKPVEKGNFKIVADFLASAYELKGDKAKADEYTKKKDSIQ